LRSLEDVHRIGRELRPEALEDLGLVNALIALSSRVSQQTGIPVSRDFDGNLPPLPREIELVIYRVAQEGLTNAIRHAHGTEVAVSLKRTDGRIVLTVADDGRGIADADDGRGDGQATALGGLAGMRERAMLIDAQLEVRSRPDRGTEIVLDVPLPN
jgi:two-component system sensor histidine kinase UhpB